MAPFLASCAGKTSSDPFLKSINNISRSITTSSGFFTSDSSINLEPDGIGLSLSTTCHDKYLKIPRMSIKDIVFANGTACYRLLVRSKAFSVSLSSAPFPATPCPVAPLFAAPPENRGYSDFNVFQLLFYGHHYLTNCCNLFNHYQNHDCYHFLLKP